MEVVKRMQVVWFIVLPHMEPIAPKLRQAWRRTWFRIAEFAQADKQWSRVTGPISALIATMAQYGWQQSMYDRWVDPGGQAYVLPIQSSKQEIQIPLHMC